MKNTLAGILSILLGSLTGYSQQVQIPISYSLFVNLKSFDQYKIRDPYLPVFESFLNENQKRNATSVTHTKFNGEEMQGLLNLFVKHTELNKTVINYLYASYSTGITDFSKSEINKYRNCPKDGKMGEYYLSYYPDTIKWGTPYAKNTDKDHPVLLNYEGKFYMDSILVSDPFPPYEIRDTVIYRSGRIDEIIGLGFTEVWSVVAENGAFLKTTKFCGLERLVYDGAEALRGVDPFMNLKAHSTQENATLFKSNVTYDVFFDSWNTKSVEDMQSFMSAGEHTTNFINASNRTNLLLEILRALDKKTMVALDPGEFEKGKEKELTMDDVYNSFASRDSVEVYNPYGDPQLYIVTSYMSPSAFIGIRFIEDWYTDPAKLTFYKKVKTFAVLGMGYSNIGVPQLKTLFYVKCGS